MARVVLPRFYAFASAARNLPKLFGAEREAVRGHPVLLVFGASRCSYDRTHRTCKSSNSTPGLPGPKVIVNSSIRSDRPSSSVHIGARTDQVCMTAPLTCTTSKPLRASAGVLLAIAGSAPRLRYGTGESELKHSLVHVVVEDVQLELVVVVLGISCVWLTGAIHKLG